MADAAGIGLETGSNASLNPSLPTLPSQNHTPAVSSPLNPDVSTAKSRTSKVPPREREPREKRDTLKKREATEHVKGSTPSAVLGKRKATEDLASIPSPMRYSIPDPRITDYDIPKEIVFASHEPSALFTPDGAVELKKPVDLAENKKGYRYDACIADPQFRHKQYYRQTDLSPHRPQMSFADADKWMHFDTNGHYITNEQGWRMARANVCAREGTYYYEVKIVRGVSLQEQSVLHTAETTRPRPHVRMGWARREAPLDAPVGFDAYSYGVTDIRFEPIHRSRPTKFFQPKTKKTKLPTKPTNARDPGDVMTVEINEQVSEGDVIGLEIVLPSLKLHRKVVNGVYNPAVDLVDGVDDFTPPARNEPGAECYDIIRDRIPVPYKGNVYFETMDYVASKAMEAYSDRTLSVSNLSSSGSSSSSSILKSPPNPNHIEPTLRTLPNSSMRVYKNGQLVGTAFENLLAFLPPASAPSKAAGAREGYDDGLVGYFPAVACFSGGIAEVNLGTEEGGFWFPPPHMLHGGVELSGLTRGQITRPIGERYKEQIAEDVVWDIVDEVDFFVLDGGYEGGRQGPSALDASSVLKIASLKEESS